MVQCGSRSFSPAERNYAPIEQECLAITWAIAKCRHYLLGNPGFTVVTDHNPLVGIFKKHLADITNRRLQRLRESVVGYQFTVDWVAGKSHHMADALSRYPVDSPAGAAIAAAVAVVPSELEEFAKLAQADAHYKRLIECVTSLDSAAVLSLIHI